MAICFNIKNRGFTFVELMVAISIVGFLSSVVLTSVKSTRLLSRDSQRVQTLEQIKNALELYYHDNGVYPPGAFTYTLNLLTVKLDYSTDASYWGDLASYLVPKYIPQLPLDPLNNMSSICYLPWDIICSAGNTRNGYTYMVSLDGQKYDLITVLEANQQLMCKNKKWPTNALMYDASGTWCSSAAVLKIDNLYQANH